MKKSVLLFFCFKKCTLSNVVKMRHFGGFTHTVPSAFPFKGGLGLQADPHQKPQVVYNHEKKKWVANCNCSMMMINVQRQSRGIENQFAW